MLELAGNGKAHLVPVAIMVNGTFYDASAYKADPVPMALQSGTVYEVEKAGVSQGLFTVSGAVSEHDSWIGDGTWRSEQQIQAEKERAKSDAALLARTAPEDVSGPPRLHRSPEPDEHSSVPEKTQNPPASSPPSGSAQPSKAPSSQKSVPENEDNSGLGPETAPGRPILRREPASDVPHEQTKSSAETEPLKGPIQFLAAVSDADGPEPRSYAFQLKPEQEQELLKKMLAMAANEVKTRATHLASETEPATKASRKKTPEPAPELKDVQMHIFDLSASNEPVLVLTANATVPNARQDLQYMTTLVAREDIYGDLHKVFAQTTDNQHLDILPRYEFIDAVDADGDERGELLFRTVSDSGSAFSIYAVIGHRLWPLFQGQTGS